MQRYLCQVQLFRCSLHCDNFIPFQIKISIESLIHFYDYPILNLILSDIKKTCHFQYVSKTGILILR